MAKKLSNLFFSTIRRAARMQRQALQRVGVPVAKKPRKLAQKKTAKRASARTQPSPAAATPRPPGKGVWQNFVHKIAPSRTELMGRLSYSLYRPKDRPVAGLPLVVMLHGCQQTAYEMACGTRMNQLADQKGFVVAYPQQAKRAQFMRCWRWFQPDAGHGLAEADVIADLTSAIVRKYRLDSSRTYVAGMSAGAGMAALTALRHPDVFAAAALHSGAVMGAAHSAASGLHVMRRGSTGAPAQLIKPLLKRAQAFPGLPVMILHGTRDRVVSVRNAVQLARQFSHLNSASRINGAVLGQDTHREYSRQDFLQEGRVAVRLCLLKEVGHAWSGGDGRFKFNSEKGPRASVLIWQFFAMHALAGNGRTGVSARPPDV